MNVTIISGSNRPDSGSKKVADYLSAFSGEAGFDSADVLDMYHLDLPLFMTDQSSTGVGWERVASFQKTVSESDALVVIAAEWNGTIPPSLHNALMYMDREMVGHKPVLLIGVSAGIGGTYPISQLHSFSAKNNRMLFIPDHVIVRNVNDDFDAGEHPIGPRIKASIEQLMLYAKHMKNLRDEMTFDYQQFGHGM